MTKFSASSRFTSSLRRPGPERARPQPEPADEHLFDQCDANALALEGRRHADLVYIEFRHLVGVAVDDCSALSDHNPADNRDQHDVAGFGEIGGKPLGPDRLVEYFVGHAIEYGASPEKA